MAIGVMRDPLQGYDIRVSAVQIVDGSATGQSGSTPRLAGAFNSFMWRVISQTEAYLMLGSRLPRLLDGEIITVWSLDQGLVNLDVVGNTFGKDVAENFTGRDALIPRQQRFNLIAEAGMGITISSLTPRGEAGFNMDGGADYNLKVTLRYARVDTLTFGVAPGKAPAANAWQGTAEGCDDGTGITTVPLAAGQQGPTP